MTDILSLRNGVATRTTAKNVLKLRKMGLDAQQISGELDMPLDRVKNIISNALKALAKEMRGQAEQIRSLELTRLDELQTAIWADCMGGKLTAIDRVLKIMERRSKLVGLDAPERLDIKADMKLEHMKEAKDRLMSKILDIMPEEKKEEFTGELPAPEVAD